MTTTAITINLLNNPCSKAVSNLNSSLSVYERSQHCKSLLARKFHSNLVFDDDLMCVSVGQQGILNQQIRNLLCFQLTCGFRKWSASIEAAAKLKPLVRFPAHAKCQIFSRPSFGLQCLLQHHLLQRVFRISFLHSACQKFLALTRLFF